jgi:prepilin-type N-terminal cleavage/methylation domain-containing protein
MFNSKVMSKSRERGFTLVEMMVVVAVILILIGTLVPMYKPFAARARVTKAASAANCLRAGLTGFSDWNSTKQTEVFNALGSQTADFYEVSDALGCGVGPTVDHQQMDTALITPRFCLITINRPNGTVIKIGCVELSSAQLAPGDVITDYEMSFDVPKVENARVGVTSRGVTIEDDLDIR